MSGMVAVSPAPDNHQCDSQTAQWSHQVTAFMSNEADVEETQYNRQ